MKNVVALYGPRGEKLTPKHNGRHNLAYYMGADSGRINGRWPASRYSADSTLVNSGERWQIIYRTRERIANDPLLKGAMLRLVNNVIGKGFVVKSNLDYARLGISEQQANDLENDIDSIWEHWCRYEFDYAGNQARRFTFDEALRLWYETEKVTGENILLPRYVERPGYKMSFCVQTIETDRIKNPDLQATGNLDIRDGIEIGARGEVVAMWVANQHPGDLNRKKPIEYQRIRAVSPAGREQFRHIYLWYRPEATRGEPGCAASLAGARNLGDYVKDTMTLAEMATMLGIIFFQENPMTTDDMVAEGDRAGDSREQHYNQMEMFAGGIYNAYPGDKVSVLAPSMPGPQFGEFTERMATLIGAPLGLTREMMINSYNGMSFSAAKASRDEAQRGFVCEQKRVAYQYVLPWRERVIEEAWLRGMLPMPGFDDPELRQHYFSCKYYAHPWRALEPNREEAARETRIKNRLTSLEIEAGSDGLDWEDLQDQQLKEEKRRIERRKEMGLPPENPDQSGDAGPSANSTHAGQDPDAEDDQPGGQNNA